MGIPGESEELGGAAAGATLGPGAITALLQRLARGPASPPAPLTPGTRVGRYEIIRAIGRGGFGSVHEAHDTSLHRLVALKVLHLEQGAGPEEASEGEAAARLAHPNIAMLLDAGALEGGTPYLVYELLHGETVESRLRRGPLPPREALGVAARIARALAHAHDAGVVHRDLKPANVFLTADGEVKVLDFGVALLFGRAGPTGGTPAYMAPEQRRGEPEDARTDLYALGLLLREMLTGDGVAGGAPPAHDLPPTVQPVLAALLAEDRAARPRSARAALAELEVAERSIGAPRARRCRRNAWAAALGLAAAAALLLRETRPPAVAARAPSVAVLPFTDLSPGKDQEYFSDGLAEEILNTLAHVEGLRVVGRTSSFSFKGRNEDLRSVGRKLDVGTVLEGSVRKDGSRVRVSAQIVNVADGFRVWSETYDRELTGIFEVQDEIARAVAEALKVQLLRPGASALRRRATSPESYAQYLLGKHLFGRQAFSRAAQAHERALGLEPDYAPALAGLALALTYRDYGEGEESTSAALEIRERALAAAERAVALAPDLPDGYRARGFLRCVHRYDWTGGLADLERALSLQPGDAENHLFLGVMRGAYGRLEGAIAEARRAVELDPLSAPAWNALGWLQIFAGELAPARGPLGRSLDIAPQQGFAAQNLGVISLLEGNPAAAQEEFGRSTLPQSRLQGIALAQHDLGNQAEARRALEALVAASPGRYASVIAWIHAWWGDADSAYEWLDRAYARRDLRLALLVKNHPLLRKVRADPRYPALLRRMSLPVD